MTPVPEVGNSSGNGTGSFRRLEGRPREPHHVSLDTEQLVRQLAAWCRANRHDVVPIDDVPGPTETERRLLAALGGVAASLIEASERQAVHELPTAVEGWIRGAPRLPEV